MACEDGKHHFTHVSDQGGKPLKDGKSFVLYCRKCGAKSVV
jgi:hypothetical protein